MGGFAMQGTVNASVQPIMKVVKNYYNYDDNFLKNCASDKEADFKI